jgi:hypothetical protein
MNKGKGKMTRKMRAGAFSDYFRKTKKLNNNSPNYISPAYIEVRKNELSKITEIENEIKHTSKTEKKLLYEIFRKKNSFDTKLKEFSKLKAELFEMAIKIFKKKEMILLSNILEKKYQIKKNVIIEYIKKLDDEYKTTQKVLSENSCDDKQICNPTYRKRADTPTKLTPEEDAFQKYIEFLSNVKDLQKIDEKIKVDGKKILVNNNDIDKDIDKLTNVEILPMILGTTKNPIEPIENHIEPIENHIEPIGESISESNETELNINTHPQLLLCKENEDPRYDNCRPPPPVPTSIPYISEGGKKKPNPRIQ